LAIICDGLIFTLHGNNTVYPELNLLYHEKRFIKQRSIQNCSQYVNGILHFCASVTNYHSCVPTITCHYFIRHKLSETLTLCITSLLLITLIVFIYTM